MNRPNPKIDAFLSAQKTWRDELEALRAILLDTPLTEEFKWYKPVYTFQNSNLVGIAGLKDHCWIAFFKGALLNDSIGILLRPGENSQSGRVIKFTSVGQIAAIEATLMTFIHEAIAAEKAGLKVNFKESKSLVYPEELQKILDKLPALKTAFEALTPGRQRAYNLYFTAPKQSKTRESRIEKSIPKILDGKGLTDRQT